jgi:hypothetical protein
LKLEILLLYRTRSLIITDFDFAKLRSRQSEDFNALLKLKSSMHNDHPPQPSDMVRKDSGKMRQC